MGKLFVLGVFITTLFMSGCVMRGSTRDVARVDQSIYGNKGYIMGKSSETRQIKKKKTRRVYDVEIELPSPYDKEINANRGGTDTSVVTDTQNIVSQGNRGYITGGERAAQDTTQRVKQDSSRILRDSSSSRMPQVVYQQSTGPAKRYSGEKDTVSINRTEEGEKVYVVEKGDTLQKISKKIFGTTKRWKKIYEANKNVLKSPDLIKTGQQLVIPSE